MKLTIREWKLRVNVYRVWRDGKQIGEVAALDLAGAVKEARKMWPGRALRCEDCGLMYKR